MRSTEKEEEKKLFSGLVEANKAYIKIPKGFSFWWRYFTIGECMISKWFYLVLLQVWNIRNLFDKEGFYSVRKGQVFLFKCVEINLKAPVPWYGGWESLIDICESPLPTLSCLQNIAALHLKKLPSVVYARPVSIILLQTSLSSGGVTAASVICIP